jgi:AcrR family transcriptional regulator
VIAAAARAQFAEFGYDRTTFRGIAAAAGVDPALVVHFFGSKEQLFRQVTALPPAASEAMAALVDAPREELGRRFAEIVVGLLESPGSRAIILARIRSAASHPDAAALVREMVARDVTRLISAVTDDRPELRAALIGSQVVGLALVRYVVLVDPLASMGAPAVVEALAPVFQRLLIEPL